MENTHFKIRKDTDIRYESSIGGVVFYDIRKPDGENFGYITNWLDGNGNVRAFADNSYGNTPIDLEDLPF